MEPGGRPEWINRKLGGVERPPHNTAAFWFIYASLAVVYIVLCLTVVKLA